MATVGVNEGLLLGVDGRKIFEGVFAAPLVQVGTVVTGLIIAIFDGNIVGENEGLWAYTFKLDTVGATVGATEGAVGLWDGRVDDGATGG